MQQVCLSFSPLELGFESNEISKPYKMMHDGNGLMKQEVVVVIELRDFELCRW